MLTQRQDVNLHLRVHVSKYQSHISTCEIESIEMATAKNWELLLGFGPGGGGGTRDIYWSGCALAHQKRGVLGAGTAQKKGGGLRCGHNQKKGGLRHVYNPKKGEFRTAFVKREGVRNWSCSKGGLGSLFIYYFYFYLSIWLTSGGVFWQAEKGGS